MDILIWWLLLAPGATNATTAGGSLHVLASWTATSTMSTLCRLMKTSVELYCATVVQQRCLISVWIITRQRPTFIVVIYDCCHWSALLSLRLPLPAKLFGLYPVVSRWLGKSFPAVVKLGFPHLAESPGIFMRKFPGPGKSWKMTLSTCFYGNLERHFQLLWNQGSHTSWKVLEFS